MRRIPLSDFLFRVQQAGGDLTGCRLWKEGMEKPHIFHRFEKVHGEKSVKVMTNGSDNIATLVKELKLVSVNFGSGQSRIVSGPRNLSIEFGYS